MLHQVVVIIEVLAPTYSQAINNTDEWLKARLLMENMPENIIEAHVQTYFQEDAEGRRVLHLPPQGDKPSLAQHQQEMEQIEEEFQRPETD